MAKKMRIQNSILPAIIGANQSSPGLKRLSGGESRKLGAETQPFLKTAEHFPLVLGNTGHFKMLWL
jgi:hypothetical protein